MKNFYWGGKGLLLLKGICRLLKSRNNRSRTLFSFTLPLVFLLFSNLADGQEPRKDSGADVQLPVEALEIGDRIPPNLWSFPFEVINHPEGKDSIELSDYREKKLIILDFWATWCGPCISSFPKIEKLRKQFENELEIVRVTSQDKNTVTTFLARDQNSGIRNTFSIFQDSILEMFFPHRGIPHLVWLDSEGTVLYITNGNELSAEHINSILSDENSKIDNKVLIDFERPLFLSEKFVNLDSLQGYSILSKGYIPGLPSGANNRISSDGTVIGKAFTNAPLLDIYASIAHPLFTERGDKFNRKRLIIDVPSPELLSLQTKPNGEHETSNLLSFEMTGSSDKVSNLSADMLTYLNQHLDYYAIIEQVEVPCLVLKRTSLLDKIKTGGGEKFCSFCYSPSKPSKLINIPLKFFVNTLNGLPQLPYVVIDETGYNDHVDMSFSGVTDLNTLKRDLQRYDLDLIEEKRELNMLIIRKTDSDRQHNSND